MIFFFFFNPTFFQSLKGIFPNFFFSDPEDELKIASVDYNYKDIMRLLP